MITARIALATVAMAALARGVWAGLDGLLGRSLLAQVIAVGVAIAAALLLYGRIVLLMRIPEARQIEGLVMSRLRGRATTA